PAAPALCALSLHDALPIFNYAETGFTPRSRDEELRCPGGSAEILAEITDVTERMHAAGAGLDGQAFTQARDAEAGRIEQEACGRSEEHTSELQSRENLVCR